MKKQFEKLIDLKSIITLLLVVTLVFMIIYSVVTNQLSENLFLLFSNLITMIITYFFTKKTNAGDLT